MGFGLQLLLSDYTFLEFPDSLYRDVLSRSPASNSSSSFQTGNAAIQVLRGVTRAESATRRTALPSLDSTIRPTLTVPMPVDPLLVPQFYFVPLTAACWNAATEFGREVGLHNPEWKTLQSIPCSTLLEGAIATNLNSLLPMPKLLTSSLRMLITDLKLTM